MEYKQGTSLILVSVLVILNWHKTTATTDLNPHDWQCPPDSSFEPNWDDLISEQTTEYPADRNGECKCKQCPMLQCPQNQVILDLQLGNNEPGTCCDTYKCGSMPTNGTYWVNRCEKCNINEPFCRLTCNNNESMNNPNCIANPYKIILNGESWTEGQGHECVSCMCNKGDRSCFRPMCEKPNCDKPIVQEGNCCETCPETLEELVPYEEVSRTSANPTTESYESSTSSESLSIGTTVSTDSDSVALSTSAPVPLPPKTNYNNDNQSANEDDYRTDKTNSPSIKAVEEYYNLLVFSLFVVFSICVVMAIVIVTFCCCKKPSNAKASSEKTIYSTVSTEEPSPSNHPSMKKSTVLDIETV